MFRKKHLSKKESLRHLNDVYYVFKKYTLEKDIKDYVPVVQLMLKNYLQDKHAFITDEDINNAKQYIKEIDELQTVKN